MRLALPAKSMGYLPLFVASHRGFFKDDGIDIETPMMLPQLAHNALLSGDVDYHGVADSALRLAARGAPIKTIFFGARGRNYFLIAKPQFKSIEELRGKYIGIVRFGDTIELATRVAFSPRRHGRATRPLKMSGGRWLNNRTAIDGGRHEQTHPSL